MQITPSTRIVITGAPGGLGSHLVGALAPLKPRMLLVSSPGVSLVETRDKARQAGAEAHELIADLRMDEGINSTVNATFEKLGGIDILINNAGIEFTAWYHELTEQQVMDVMSVNLIAAMRLTHRFLPSMLKQGAGRIINMSSLAGRLPPACQEPYAASKAGLVAFTSSLRATYAGTGISANVICPGFVEAGIYKRLREQTGITAPLTLGTSQPETVAAALLHIIETDAPEVIVNSLPMRPLLMLQQAFPRLYEKVGELSGGHAFFKRIAEKLKG